MLQLPGAAICDPKYKAEFIYCPWSQVACPLVSLSQTAACSTIKQKQEPQTLNNNPH